MNSTSLQDPPSPWCQFEKIPQFILVSSGIIYAAGFLTILAFLDRFGIREAGSELWKARYIHIGILCVSFPAIVNGTILSLTHLIFHGRHDAARMWQRLLPIGLLVINMELLCFILIMLTRKSVDGTMIVGLTPIEWIIGLTLIGIPTILALGRLLEKLVKNASADTSADLPHTLTVSLRWILVLVVAGFDFWYFYEFKSNLDATSPWLALVYIGFCLLLGVVISTVSIYNKRLKTEGRRRAVLILVASIIGPFCYLIILTFSFGVYQYIPATRGGGDYTVSPKVVFLLKDGHRPEGGERKYFADDQALVTKPLIIIEETSWALYTADPDEAGGPSNWKNIGGEKPQLFIINKSEINRMVAQSRSSINSQK